MSIIHNLMVLSLLLLKIHYLCYLIVSPSYVLNQAQNCLMPVLKFTKHISP